MKIANFRFWIALNFSIAITHITNNISSLAETFMQVETAGRC